MIRSEIMLFQVTRTSIWDYNKKPYDKCIPIELTQVDRRTFRTPEEHDERCGQHGKWLDVGSNHRIENGRIVRDLDPVNVWGVEINSLEELMAFKKEVDEELVISISHIDQKTLSIEIYDDYRE
jgi:hypothetical protein